MNKYSSYLVCKEHLKDVKKFLNQFFEELKGKYNYEGWVTFKIPETGFIVNLMNGCEQKLTQNMTFEISVSSIWELKKYAKRYDCKIDSFLCTETKQKYNYHYIEILGPEEICKVEINFVESLK
jgi:hypothetical protein